MHGHIVRESCGESVRKEFAAVEEMAVESHDALGMLPNIVDPATPDKPEVVTDGHEELAGGRVVEDMVVAKFDDAAFGTCGREVVSERMFAGSNERAAKLEDSIVAASFLSADFADAIGELVGDIANDGFGFIVRDGVDVVNEGRKVAMRGKEGFEPGFGGVGSGHGIGSEGIGEKRARELGRDGFAGTGSAIDMKDDILTAEDMNERGGESGTDDESDGVDLEGLTEKVENDVDVALMIEDGVGSLTNIIVELNVGLGIGVNKKAVVTPAGIIDDDVARDDMGIGGFEGRDELNDGFRVGGVNIDAEGSEIDNLLGGCDDIVRKGGSNAPTEAFVKPGDASFVDMGVVIAKNGRDDNGGLRDFETLEIAVLVRNELIGAVESKLEEVGDNDIVDRNVDMIRKRGQVDSRLNMMQVTVRGDRVGRQGFGYAGDVMLELANAELS